MEAERPNSYTKGEKDTDIVITTTELTRMIRTAGIALDKIEVESCDMPFGIASGAGVIFGVTGGVTEAVIRRLVPGHGNAVMDSIAEAGMRGEEGIKEFSITYEGKELNICVASGLANARKVMEQVQSGEKQYHLIEIMACRRGCIMGGGQPIPAGRYLPQIPQYSMCNNHVHRKYAKCDRISLPVPYQQRSGDEIQKHALWIYYSGFCDRCRFRCLLLRLVWRKGDLDRHGHAGSRILYDVCTSGYRSIREIRRRRKRKDPSDTRQKKINMKLCLLLTCIYVYYLLTRKKELPTVVPFFVFKLSTFPVFYFA